jgi:hypothetical protein
MINLYNKTTGVLLGNLTESQLQFIIDQLEEESVEDTDYAITSMTLDYFVEQGVDQSLQKILRQALGNQDEVIIQWSRS